MKAWMSRFAVALSVAWVVSACGSGATPEQAGAATAPQKAAVLAEQTSAEHTGHSEHGTQAEHNEHADHDTQADHGDHAEPKTVSAALPKMVVHKSPTCGCCSVWVEHVRAAGFEVEVRDREDLSAIKERLGVPYSKGSCHTAEVGGYFVEGHVPAADIQRLLAERPKARGLTVPGMPAGSPGMEMPDGSKQAYTVELVAGDGTTTAYAKH